MEVGLSIFIGILGLVLVSFGTIVIIKREQPWVQLDRGLPRVLKGWSALTVGGVSLLLGVGALLLSLFVYGIWR